MLLEPLMAKAKKDDDKIYNSASDSLCVNHNVKKVQIATGNGNAVVWNAVLVVTQSLQP